MSGAYTQKSKAYRRGCLNGEMSDNSRFSMDFGFAGGSRRKTGILSDFGASRRAGIARFGRKSGFSRLNLSRIPPALSSLPPARGRAIRAFTSERHRGPAREAI